MLALRHTITPSYHILFFQTMFLVAFYGFCRLVGELTIKTPKRRHSILQFQSLSFLKSQREVQAAKLVISDYKLITHPDWASFYHNYSQRLDCTILSCRIFTAAGAVRRFNSGSRFCPADGSAVKTEVFTRQLKGALAFCDLDCSNRTLFVLLQLV